MGDTITLTVEQTSLLKGAAQAWMAGCDRSRHAGGHGPCPGHPALKRAVDAVREHFEAIVSERRAQRQAEGGELE